MKKCSKCLEEKPFDQFGYSSYVKKDGTRSHSAWCKKCFVKSAAAYQKANPEKQKLWDRRKHYKRQYGLSQTQYESLASKQNHVCAICLKPETHRDRSGKVAYLAVDHDHKTGQVRGLLCFACNTALGHFDDDISRLNAAIRYLSSTSQQNWYS